MNERKHKPTAFLFANGGAAFCNESGQQIPELQAHNWRGLHEFMRRYPDAEVHLQGREALSAECVRHLLKSIALPESEVAERNALARLEAWQRGGVDRTVSLEVEDGVWRVELLDYSAGHRRVIVYGAPVTGGRGHVTGIGTDDKPATLAECILAALARWEQLYGAAVELKGGA